MDRFYTRKKASEGVKIFLGDPGTGKLTDEYLVIRNRWCDEFQEAKAEAVQQAFIDAKGETVNSEAEINRKLSLVGSLIAGWSFDQECNKENVIALLKEAPQIVDQIDKVAAKDSLFFGKASGNSKSGVKKK